MNASWAIPFDPWWMYNFGIRIKKRFNSWIEVINEDEWDELVEKRKLSKAQIQYTKDGFEGKKFKDPNGYVSVDDTIIPFGPHRGKSITHVKMDYISSIADKPWIIKYPLVAQWIKRNRHKIDRYNQEYYQGIEELKQLGKQLEN